MKMISSGDRWNIAISKNRLEEYLSREDFSPLLALMRLQNSLRYGQKAIHDAAKLEKSDSVEKEAPATRRARNNSFLHMAAVLHEAQRVTRDLDLHFRENEEYQTMASAVLSKEGEDLRRKIKAIRNRLTFHFDGTHLSEGLIKYMRMEPKDAYRVASGTGKAQGLMYYELADQAALGSVVWELKNDELEHRMKIVIGGITDVMTKFMEATDAFLMKWLHGVGVDFSIDE